MVPIHEGGTKGSVEYWDFGEDQEFAFVNTVLPNLYLHQVVFHSENCPTMGITSSYDSYTSLTLVSGHHVSLAELGVGSSRAIFYHVGLGRARRAQYYIIASRQ